MGTKVIDVLTVLFFGLVPPAHPEDWSDKEQLAKWRKAKDRWRRFVAVALWVGFGLFLFLVPPVYGVLPPEFDRIAWAEDVQTALKPVKESIAHQDAKIAQIDRKVEEINEKLDEKAEADLLQSILQAKNEQCAASREGRSASYWSDELAKRRDRYLKTTGRVDSVPTDCGKF